MQEDPLAKLRDIHLPPPPSWWPPAPAWWLLAALLMGAGAWLLAWWYERHAARAPWRQARRLLTVAHARYVAATATGQGVGVCFDNKVATVTGQGSGACFATEVETATGHGAGACFANEVAAIVRRLSITTRSRDDVDADWRRLLDASDDGLRRALENDRFRPAADIDGDRLNAAVMHYLRRAGR